MEDVKEEEDEEPKEKTPKTVEVRVGMVGASVAGWVQGVTC